MSVAILAPDVSFVSVVVLIIVGAVAAFFVIGFVLVPLPRYLGSRIYLLGKYLFSKASFRPLGAGMLVPHFYSDRPDYLVLSGNKLYIVKFQTCRRKRTRVTFLSDETWQYENIVGSPPQDNGSFFYLAMMAWHDRRVHQRFRRAPMLFLYARRINKSLSSEKVDCIPVVLFAPSVREFQTAGQIAMLSGDCTFYGTVVANSSYPVKTQSPSVGKAEAKRILKLAKQELKKPLRKG